MNLITKEHILKALTEVDNNGIRAGRHSSTYDLSYNGKLYPPKLIISIANRFATGEELDPKDFSGGSDSECFNILENFGFEIIPKKLPLNELISNYKKHIRQTQMKDEVYKWELVSQFKGRPDVNAPDFDTEYKEVKFGNLIYAMAGGVGNHICREKPEEFRALFVELFDEEIPLKNRVIAFNEKSLALYRSIGETLGHHQDERTISAYLTFHNPDKYTFYKSSFYKEFCKLLGLNPTSKNEKYGNYLTLLNQFISDYVASDDELIELVKSFIPKYYDGTNHLLLAQDILYTMLDQKKDEELDVFNENVKYWIYAPGEKAYKWDEFYSERIMALGWDHLGDLTKFNSKKEIAEKLRQFDGSDGSKKNNAHANYEFHKAMAPGDIVFVKRGKQEFLGYGVVASDYYYDDSRADYKSCRKVNWLADGIWRNSNGSTVVKTLTDITQYKDYVNELKKMFGIKNQVINPLVKMSKEPINQILYGPPGTGKTYKLKSQYFDRYTTKETSISKEQHVENVIRDCSWWQVIGLTLLELKKAKVSDIASHPLVAIKTQLSNSNTVRPTIWGQLQSHTIEECEFVNVKTKQQPFIFNKTEDSFWEILEDETKEQNPELYEILDSINNFNPNPDKEIKRYVFTTFHQSYSYEDFIEGIKPIMSEDEVAGSVGYSIENGIFKELCQRASSDPENQYAIFIDEINRGNVSAIFGELITLIETDKRKNGKNPMNVTLPYSKKSFTVPSNVDIIGTMNTADRSVEALDTALRRRFTFEEMLPNPTLLKETIEGISIEKLLTTINERIEVLVDRDHTIGHAFFINDTTLDHLRNTFANKVIPLLQEYFYGDYSKMEMVIGSAFFDVKETNKVKFAVKSDNFDPEGKVYHIKNIASKEVISDDYLKNALNQILNTED